MGLFGGSAVLLLGVLQLLSWVTTCTAAKVVHLRFSHKMAQRQISRRDTVETGLQNYLPQFQYFITAKIGTPPQTNELLVDTGSSDSYVLAKGHCQADDRGFQDTYYAFCEGGLFDASESNSYTELPGMGDFTTSFTGGTGIGGNYFSDAFRFDNATVEDFIMGYGTRNRGQFTGLLGLGFPINEAGFQGRRKTGPYPNLPEKMVDQGLISSNSFSIYLDDASSSTGNILFGGYDTAKYTGDLVMLPFMKTWSPSKVTEFALPFTSMGVNKGRDSKVTLETFESLPAILDSGSPGIYLHKDSVDQIVSELADLSSEFRDSPHSLSCHLADLDGSVNFGFGEGSNSIVIPVPIAELVLPKYHPDGARKYNDEGKPACHFGIYPAYGITILGQYFMRSAYTFFDIDNLAGGLAPAVFQTEKSHVIEYAPNSANDRLNGMAISLDPSTFDTSGTIVTTVTPNPVTHTAYPVGFGSLGPLNAATRSKSQHHTSKTTRVQIQATSSTYSYSYSSVRSFIPSIPTPHPTRTVAGAGESPDPTGSTSRETQDSAASSFASSSALATHLAWIVVIISEWNSIF